MAEHGDGGGGGGAGSDAIFFLLVLLFLAVVFFFSGAAKRANVTSLFVPFPGAATSTFGLIGAPSVAGTAPTPNVGGFDPEETNAITTEIATLQQGVAGTKTTPNSPYAGKVILTTAWNSRSTNPDDEYVILRAPLSNKQGVTISGWRLQSAVSRVSAVIPAGSELYTPEYGYIQTGSITLLPGEEAIVTSGRSPVGVSFQVNMCSGYLGQFQKFSPPLSVECPRPQDELNAQPDRLLFADNKCYDHLSLVGSCRIVLAPPTTLTQACRDFIYRQITYKGCVATHQSDKGFKRPQWRIYLGAPTNLWREKREAIVLIDSENRVVDSTLY